MEFVVQKIFNDEKEKRKFLIIFCVILLTHLYIMVNIAPNYDSVYLLIHDVDATTSGRWSLSYLCLPSGSINMPYINGMLGILYLSVGGYLVGKILRFNNALLAVIAGILYGIYPTVASTMTFTFVLDGYFLGLLLCVIAVYLFLQKSWIKRLGGSVLLGIGMGAYQANLSMAGVLFMAAIFGMALRRTEIKELLRTVFGGFCGAVLGCVVYGLGLGKRLGWNFSKLLSYQGIDQVTIAHDFKYYLRQIKESYISLWDLIYNKDTNGYKALCIVTIIALVLSVVLLCANIVRAIAKKQIIVSIIEIISVLCIPLIIFVFRFASEGVSYYRMMEHSAVGIWLFSIVLLDNRDSDIIAKNKIREIFYKITEECLLLSIIIISCAYFLMTNIGYLSITIQYEKSYALTLRMVDRISQVEEWENVDCLYIEPVDGLPFCNLQLKNPIDGTGMGGIVMYAEGTYRAMIRNYVGIDKVFYAASPEQIEEIKNSKEYQEMPNWPATDSVKVINNVIVIKSDI